MIVKILGAGCPKCLELAQNVEQAAADLGLQVSIEKVSSFAEFARYGVMATPALVVDDVVKSKGQVLGPAEIGEIPKSSHEH